MTILGSGLFSAMTFDNYYKTKGGMHSFNKALITTFALILAAGCSGAQYHRDAVRNDEHDRLTVGKVQREIRVGMSGGEVITVLGSPNIVSTDEQRREMWVYDKIATDRVYSSEAGGISSLILGGGPVGAGLLGGAGGGSYNSDSGASSTSQRTLTVVVKFDDQKRVRDFAYHSSSF